MLDTQVPSDLSGVTGKDRVLLCKRIGNIERISLSGRGTARFSSDAVLVLTLQLEQLIGL